AVADELGINIPAAQIKHVFTALDHSRDGEVQTTDLMNIIFRGTGVVVKEDAVQQGAGFKSLAQGVANKMTKSNAEIAGKSLQSTDESPSKKSPGHQRRGEMASLILAATNLGKITGAMPLLARKSMADENSPAWHNFQEKLERRKAISQRLQAFHKDVGTLRDLGKELREGSDQMASTIHRAAGKGVLLSARRRALRRRNSAVDSSMLSPSSGAEETYSSMLSPSSSVRYLAELYGEAQPEKTKMKAEGKSVFGSVLDSLGGFVSPSGSDEEREEVSDEDAQAQMGTATGPAGDLDAKSTSSSKDKSEKSEVGSSSDDASESQSSSSSSGSSSSEGEEEEGMQGVHDATEDEPFWDWLYSPTEQPDVEEDGIDDPSQGTVAPRDSNKSAQDTDYRPDREVKQDRACGLYDHPRGKRNARTCHMNRICAGPSFPLMGWFKLQDLN
ncbi:hypothetical protein CYMTET_29028, partial [Cymbomonas tetramitiformis]